MANTRPRLTAEAVHIVSQPERPDLLRQLLNDYGNAQRLMRLYGENLSYCHAIRKWLVWDKRRWKPDTTGEAHRLAKQAMLEFVSQALGKCCNYGQRDRLVLGEANWD